MLHQLNPRIEIKCDMLTSMEQIIARLSQYLSGNGSLENVIGYRNVLKIAPEVELLKEILPQNAKTNDGETEDHVIVWAQGSCQKVIMKDVYLALNSPGTVFLYYYWDTIDSKGDDMENNTGSYYVQRGSQKDLQSKEFNDFVQLMTQLIQNVVQRNKKQKRRKNKKLPVKEAEKSPEKKSEPANQNVASLTGSKKDDLGKDIDMDHPFQKLFASSKHSSSLGCDEVLQPFPNPKVSQSALLVSKEETSQQDQVVENEKEYKNLAEENKFNLKENEASMNSMRNSLMSGDGSRLAGGFPAIGSATNSMLLPSFTTPMFTGLNSNAFLMDDTIYKDRMHMQSVSRHAVPEAEAIPRPENIYQGEPLKKRAKLNQRGNRKVCEERIFKPEACNKTPSKRNEISRDPPGVNANEGLPHPNYAFNISPINVQQPKEMRPFDLAPQQSYKQENKKKSPVQSNQKVVPNNPMNN